MLDLEIRLLRVRIDNGAGHEHRIAPITSRAAAILAARLDAGRLRGLAAAEALAAPPVRVDLARMSDAAAAHEIAAAWLAALTPTPAGEGPAGRGRA